MSDEQITGGESGRYSPNDGGKNPPRKVSFDDFEIHGESTEKAEKKNVIPRIKGLKDDLLGGGKRLSSKIFRQSNDGASTRQQDMVEDDFFEQPAPEDLPYFSSEELSNVRIRKIPKPQSTPIEQIHPPAEDPVESVEEIESKSDELFASIEEEQYEPEEIEELLIEEEIEEVTPVTFEEATLPRELAEERYDPAIKVYLDTLRGFAAAPRRASEVRDPRKDFVLLLSEILDLIREQVDSLSVLFFWTNTKKAQLVLECASLDDFAFTHLSRERRFPIGHDAVSKVALRAEPQLVESIAPQAEYDLIPYYQDTVGIRSFAAMPVLFGDNVVAVLAVDSLEEDHFTPETLRIMTNYSKVITGLVRSYIEAYDLITSARTLKAARKLFGISHEDIVKRTGKDAERTGEYIMRSLSEAASELVDWQWLATVSFDDAQRAWCISGLQAKVADPYLLPKTRIDLAESIVGRTLRSGKSEHIDELSQQSIRFSIEEEKSSAAGHSFLVIPVRTASKNYGALVVEHSDAGKYTDVDIETLEHLARSAATSLEIFALSEVVQERALTDILTSNYNRRGFKERFTEELARAKEFDESLSLILFEIDDSAKFEERFLQEDIDTIILALSNVLQFIKQPFDVLARTGEFTFGVLLIKMSDEEAFLWSEKVRQKIVSEVIALSRKSFTITTSIGVAGARRNSTPDELLVCAKMALDKAKERGGNEVIVY
ncbi:MAG TPA: GAF domain-containing protein [Candidatus Kapabacteria bacterium]